MQECGGSSLKTTKNDNHGYQIGLGKFRIIAKKSLFVFAPVFSIFSQMLENQSKSLNNYSTSELLK